VQISNFHPLCGNLNIERPAEQLNFRRESGENMPNLQFSDFGCLFHFWLDLALKCPCETAKNEIRSGDLNVLSYLECRNGSEG
jgi:hypothetical protein